MNLKVNETSTVGYPSDSRDFCLLMP